MEGRVRRMSTILRKLALVAAMGLLGACQQAVRPNIAPEAAPAEPVTVAPEPEQIDSEVPPPPITEEIETPALPTGADVFARIKKGLRTQACTTDKGSERWRQRYAHNPREFAKHLERILPLLDFVSQEVEALDLPAEFIFIPLVESWYRPDAMGPGGPAGMWQMISSTARNHHILIKTGYDGRLSPVQSTRAALSYLSTLQSMFDSWQAVLMAYNAGEGRLSRAFKRANSRDVSAAERKPHGMSNITYDYVAKLQALSCLIAEPEKQGLELPLSAQFVPLSPVLVADGINSLAEFADKQGLDATELKRLNPAYKSGRIVDGVPRLVLMPVGERLVTAPTITLALVQSPKQPPAEIAATYEVRAGDSLWLIAKRHGMTAGQLKQLNGLGSSSVLQPGQTLKLVP